MLMWANRAELGSPGKLPGRGKCGAQLGSLEAEQCSKERGSGSEVEPRKRGRCKMNRSCWSNTIWKNEGRRCQVPVPSPGFVECSLVWLPSSFS